MNFLDALRKSANTAKTENGATTNANTLNPLLEFFSLAGAMRGKKDEVVQLFEKAFMTDRLGAVRCLFYLRDIRGGQGERDLFRACFERLIDIDSELAAKLARYIPEYGRWDDYLLPQLVAEQLVIDEESMRKGERVSLMAKWLPSENASSANNTKRALRLAEDLGLKPREYRKKVVALRKYIKLLEHKMSTNEWLNIDYETLPSQAGRKHVKAFRRHDNDRYTQYLEDVMEGTKKINTSTLYTYEVFETITIDVAAANAMWNSLPDYTNGADALVVADVSGSMSGRPMSVSVSLALYYAERNRGIFSNKFMTFSENPRVVDVVGDTLDQRLKMIQSSEWGMNTNVEAVFDAILRAAVESGTGQEGMPKVLYIISDMEFDSALRNPEASIFTNATESFRANGLELPHVVFWNVNVRQAQVPATKFDNNVTLISGMSQSAFRYAVEGLSPEELMASILDSERYSSIEI